MGALNSVSSFYYCYIGWMKRNGLHRTNPAPFVIEDQGNITSPWPLWNCSLKSAPRYQIEVLNGINSWYCLWFTMQCGDSSLSQPEYTVCLRSTMMELYNSQIALNQSAPVFRASTRVPWSEKWFFINLDVMVVTPQCRLHLSLTSHFLMFFHSLCILLFIFLPCVSVRISLFRYF